MEFIVDTSPYGSRVPDCATRAIIGMTRRLPDSYVGLRTSMPLRRIALEWMGDQAIDTAVWNAKARLYPYRNSCEKMALFTPQMYDVLERSILAEAIDRRLAAGSTFSFVDVGANVGLYSLFVAARAGARGRIVAIEPQPAINARLEFNLRANPDCPSDVLRFAVSDRDGAVDMVIHQTDAAGSHIDRGEVAHSDAEVTRVACRTLSAIVAEARLSTIDALKIDIEGHEDRALAPFLRDAPRPLLPRLILLEDRTDWQSDLKALLKQSGYVETTRSRYNIVYKLGTDD